MTITEMISLFDLVQDKVDEIYYTDAEKVEFLNASQNLLIENIVYSRDEDEGIDASKQKENILKPLRKKDTVITMAVVGNPTDAELDTACGGTLLHLEAIKREDNNTGTYYPCRWVREGERDAFADNTFKAPSATRPTYLLDLNGVFIEPIPTEAGQRVKVSTIRFPVAMVSPGTSCELIVGVHEQIVAGALAIAGIASKDDSILMFSQLVK